MIKFNSNTVSKWYDGILNAKKAYHGNNLIFLEYLQGSQPSYKLVAQYSDASEYKVECNGSSVLTPSEVSGHTTAKSAMTSAVVSDCVHRIETNAFYGCSAMTAITLDDNITEFGNQAFFGCSGLTSFTFPSGLTKIEGACFRLANSIKRIEGIPSGVTALGSGCFADMTGLSAATIPSSVTSASTNLFLRDTNLKEVHFEGTTPPTLGSNAFGSCTSLQKIYIPSCDSYDAYAANDQFSAYTDLIYSEDVTKCKPESYPFVFKREHKGGSAYTRACDSTSATTLTSGMTLSGTNISTVTGTSKQVTAITVGDCTNKIDAGAFSGWTKVTSIIISDSVQEISDDAFYRCGYSSTGTKTALNLGRGIKKIGADAFRNANAISSITLPGKIINFTGSYTFYNISSLTGVTFKEGFDISGSNATFMFSTCNIKKVTLPNSLTIVPNNMFNSNPISSLTIGNNVASIGMNAFYGHSVNNIVVPDSVTSISSSSFRTTATTVFNSVKIGNGCTSIGASAFSYNFESIDIGSGITSIAKNSLYNTTCKQLICRATTPPSCSSSAFGSWSADGVDYPQIYVPDESVNAYKSASFWSTHKAKIHPLSDLPS